MEVKEKSYNFLDVNPLDIMTKDDIEHFEEAMLPINTSKSADEVNISAAVDFVLNDLDNLLFN